MYLDNPWDLNEEMIRLNIAHVAEQINQIDVAIDAVEPCSQYVSINITITYYPLRLICL